jgi:glycerol uptake operon antiterminator
MFSVIASISREDQLASALSSDVERVNLLTGNILNIKSVIEKLQEAGKQVYVHMEMVSGLGRDTHAIAYLAQEFKVNGIITTKANSVAAARQAGIRSIQRIFAIDTAALQTACKMIGTAMPDEVELMPGLMPRIIQELKGKIRQPLIVGGLIRHAQEIREALGSGADYISCGSEQFWKSGSY